MSEKIINKSNLIHNLNYLKKQSGAKLFCAVVKANAYGHGLEKVVSAIKDRVDYFAVASSLEAKTLSKLKTGKKILVLGRQIDYYINKHVEYAISSMEELKALEKHGKMAGVHLKLNTGMNRFGCDEKRAKLLIRYINSSKYLNLVGVFSHFAFAEDEKSFLLQKERFDKIIVKLKLSKNVIIHLSNTAGSLRGAGYDMCRCGLGLYGYGNNELKPVMQIKSPILAINNLKIGSSLGYGCKLTAAKEMKVAVVGIGYADGFNRAMNGGKINIGGKNCDILGLICMDYVFVDVSNIKSVKVGDYALILSKENNAAFFSKKTKKSVYEILCDFNKLR